MTGREAGTLSGGSRFRPAGRVSGAVVVKKFVIAVSGVLLVASLSGCVTKAAGRAIEAPGHIVGGLLGG